MEKIFHIYHNAISQKCSFICGVFGCLKYNFMISYLYINYYLDEVRQEKISRISMNPDDGVERNYIMFRDVLAKIR